MSVATTLEPPFYRGEEVLGWCDFLLPSGNTCDAAARYDVWWMPVQSLDGDSRPVSGACAVHVLSVDRALVEQMRTHS